MKTKRARGRPASRFKYIRRNYGEMILIGLVVVLSVMSGFYFGSAYGVEFNMTDDLRKEERIVQACIAFNIEAAECEMVYGGTPGDGIITDEDAKGLKLR